MKPLLSSSKPFVLVKIAQSAAATKVVLLFYLGCIPASIISIRRVRSLSEMEPYHCFFKLPNPQGVVLKSNMKIRRSP